MEGLQTIWDVQPGETKVPVWIDCDTGHDDAFALLLAAHHPKLDLLGVSCVHGNSSLTNTTRNTLSILEAIGKRDIRVYPGAAKPFCRESMYAPDIHGESGLDGTTILPSPITPAEQTSAIHAIYRALSQTPPQSAWLISTGALTNIGLLFSIYPSLIPHIAGLSIMGGAIGGFFTHAPIGRLRERVNLCENLHEEFPGGLPDDADLSLDGTAAHFRKLGLLRDAEGVDDERVRMLLEQARRSFGNTTHYAEFNIFCDPEAAAAVFSDKDLAAKTTLIPLDITHQVLANDEIMKVLSGNIQSQKAGIASSPLRHLFLEIITFFAQTYEREFGMNDGPPLHDPIAVAVALQPDLFDDNGGERYEIHVVRDGDDSLTDHRRNGENVGQCGRTIARLVKKGEPGIRIPRTLRVSEFWKMIHLALGEAEKLSPVRFGSEPVQ